MNKANLETLENIADQAREAIDRLFETSERIIKESSLQERLKPINKGETYQIYSSRDIAEIIKKLMRELNLSTEDLILVTNIEDNIEKIINCNAKDIKDLVKILKMLGLEIQLRRR